MDSRSSPALLGVAHAREAAVLRLAVSVARAVVAGHPYQGELVDGVAVCFGAEGGAGLTHFRTWPPDRVSVTVTASSGVSVPPGQMQRAAPYTRTHPSFAAMARAGTRYPVRTSDHTRMNEFWETPEFLEMHGWLPSARFPAALVLHSDATASTFIGLHRDRQDFDDGDLAALGRLQAVVSPAVTLMTRVDRAVDRLGELGIMAADARSELTRREEQVLALAAGGMTSGAIARHLHITERTVRKHLGAVYAKTGASGRAAAAAWWAFRRQPELARSGDERRHPSAGGDCDT